MTNVEWSFGTRLSIRHSSFVILWSFGFRHSSFQNRPTKKSELTPMDTNILFIFILAIFVGFEVISKVPSMLHTPLMSGTNAIHGIILFGGILVLADAQTMLTMALGFVAVVFGSANVFGGFMVTDRMLQMFKKKK
jgi:NAD(P) transhydrogenase subunit alpha